MHDITAAHRANSDKYRGIMAIPPSTHGMLVPHTMGKVFLTVEQAIEILGDAENYRVVRESETNPPALSWFIYSRSILLEFMRTSPTIELTGSVAQSMGLSVALTDDRGFFVPRSWIFVECAH